MKTNGFLNSFQERYKTDMGLAIQLLQCKPDGVVAHKITTVSFYT